MRIRARALSAEDIAADMRRPIACPHAGLDPADRCASCLEGWREVGRGAEAAGATVPRSPRCEPIRTCDTLDCGPHGTCAEQDGAFCACEPGWAGPRCDTCAPLFEPLPGGVCALGDACARARCGGHGRCVVAGGEIACRCDTGWDSDGECGGPGLAIGAPAGVLVSGEPAALRVATADGYYCPGRFVWSIESGGGVLEPDRRDSRRARYTPPPPTTGKRIEQAVVRAVCEADARLDVSTGGDLRGPRRRRGARAAVDHRALPSGAGAARRRGDARLDGGPGDARRRHRRLVPRGAGLHPGVRLQLAGHAERRRSRHGAHSDVHAHAPRQRHQDLRALRHARQPLRAAPAVRARRRRPRRRLAVAADHRRRGLPRRRQRDAALERARQPLRQLLERVAPRRPLHRRRRRARSGVERRHRGRGAAPSSRLLAQPELHPRQLHPLPGRPGRDCKSFNNVGDPTVMSSIQTRIANDLGLGYGVPTVDDTLSWGTGVCMYDIESNNLFRDSNIGYSA